MTRAARGALWRGVLMSALALGCEPSARSAPPQAATLAQPQPWVTRPLPAAMRRGICLAHSWQQGGQRGYGTAASAKTLDELVAKGATWVSLTPFGWMESSGSSRVLGEHQGLADPASERLARLEAAVAQARERGLRVQLKPHLWIQGGAWVGFIQPSDWGAWWDSYREFILYYARHAQRLGVESLVLGVELVSALRADDGEQQLARTIEQVRQVYRGELTYGANWDERVPASSWLALDQVSVNLYAPLSASVKPTRQELIDALRAQLQPWLKLAAQVQRPLLITEVGFKSAPDAVRSPYSWPERLAPHERRPDQALQALAYEALMEALRLEPDVQGVFLWKTFTDPDTQEEGELGFSTRGKLADQVVRRAFGPASP